MLGSQHMFACGLRFCGLAPAGVGGDRLCRELKIDSCCLYSFWAINRCPLFVERQGKG
jgi:hypothetical protein